MPVIEMTNIVRAYWTVGIIFGFWPAYNASLRSPIEALRSE